MDDTEPMLVLALLVALAGIGIGALVMDLRHFDNVVAQCQEQGYIQNNTIRIYCNVEDKK